MTALPAEVEGAIAEGIELVTLKAPLRVEADAEGKHVHFGYSLRLSDR